MKIKKITTKELIFLEAFKLFSKKPYDKVTYSDLENSTGLSRGAIIYHIKSKENLFATVVNEFIFKRSSIAELSFENGDGLKSFILRFVENCHIEKQDLKKKGVNNISLTLLNLNSQAFYYCTLMQMRFNEWIKNQLSTWNKIIRISVDRGELKNDIDVEFTSIMFHNIYFGTLYTGIVEDKGYDLDLMEKEFFFIYNMIKKT